MVHEINIGDAIMADKGFDIQYCKVRRFRIFHSVIPLSLLDVSTKYGQWFAYCQIFKTLFLHDLIISSTIVIDNSILIPLRL